MTNRRYILSIDQGTTSSRAIIFDNEYTPLIVAQQEFTQQYPQDGWVEHDPEEIWQSTLDVCLQALAKANGQGIKVAGIGITNQRETTVIWDKNTGKPIYNAIVWQDRRTAPYCQQLAITSDIKDITERTGLVVDSYFSATKINWILENVPGARAKADKGELAFGTIDTFLLWRFTAGQSHLTDATNASRTLLFNIHSQTWDPELLDIFNVPSSLLPEVRDCASEFGTAGADLLGYSIPILGIAGDQHAASIGQACFSPGMIKSTYGTGCFVMMNIGEKATISDNKLLTTTAYRLNGQATYALEGSIFNAGAAIQWLRDGLKVIENAQQTEALAASLTDNKGVYLVPAFTGLGAPYWDPDARGGIFGLTRNTGVAEIVRATLEAVCYQTKDLMQAMASGGQPPVCLRVDGGMVNNSWVMQFLADVLNLKVQRPVVTETTALGAAMLAGLGLGWHQSLDDLKDHWRLEKEFTTAMDAVKRDALLQDWHQAVDRVRSQ